MTGCYIARAHAHAYVCINTFRKRMDKLSFIGANGKDKNYLIIRKPVIIIIIIIMIYLTDPLTWLFPVKILRYSI